MAGQCSNFYEVEIPSCTEEIILLSQLADDDYVLKITDKFNKAFYIDFSSVSGLATIDLTDLPAGLLTPYAGNFILEVFQDQETDQSEVLTICDVDYGGVMLTLQNSNSVPSSFSIGCP
jgi:hypothetical protein